MLTISTREFVHPGNILLSPYVSVSNHGYTHTLLDLVVEQHYIINIITSQTVPHREGREAREGKGEEGASSYCVPTSLMASMLAGSILCGVVRP